MTKPILLSFLLGTSFLLAQAPETPATGAKTSPMPGMLEPAKPPAPNPQPAPARAGVAKPAGMGVQYFIYSADRSGKFAQRRVGEAFRSGERIQLVLQGSEDGYFRVMARQEKEPFTLLFPHPKLYQGNASARALDTVRIPLRFDNRPGRIEVLVAFISKRSGNQKLLQLAEDRSDTQTVPFAEMVLTSMGVGSRGLVVDTDDSETTAHDTTFLDISVDSWPKKNLVVPVRFFLRHE